MGSDKIIVLYENFVIRKSSELAWSAIWSVASGAKPLYKGTKLKKVHFKIIAGGFVKGAS